MNQQEALERLQSILKGPLGDEEYEVKVDAAEDAYWKKDYDEMNRILDQLASPASIIPTLVQPHHSCGATHRSA